MMDGSMGMKSGFWLFNDASTETTMDQYRGALISQDAASATFSFALEGFPLIGWCGLKCRSDITVLVDAWLDQGQLLTPPPKEMLPGRTDAIG